MAVVVQRVESRSNRLLSKLGTPSHRPASVLSSADGADSSRAARRVRRDLVESVRTRLYQGHPACDMLRELERAVAGNLFVFGGTVRRAIFGGVQSADIDIMVPNWDDRAFAALRNWNIPCEMNRRGHRRFRWHGVQIDVNQPKEWDPRFRSVAQTLRYFDLRVNSLAVHLGSGVVLDPLRLLVQRDNNDIGVNWKRWSRMPPTELVLLGIRLLRILDETHQYSISREDRARARRLILRQLDFSDWASIGDRFPSGKDEFRALTLLQL